jgi:hypothetical protein
MKVLLLIILFFVLGIVFSFFIFKRISLSEVIRIHGLKKVIVPENTIIYNSDRNDAPVNLPNGTSMYFVKAAEESHEQYIIFVNMENIKLHPSPTKVKSPLIGIVK